MDLLLTVLERIRQGERSFHPLGSTSSEVADFQPIAIRLRSALEKGLVRDVRFRESRMRDTFGQFLGAIVVGGLTFEGEQLLASSSNGPDTTMKTWPRIRTALKAAQAVARSEPKELATLLPVLEEAIAIVSKPPTREAVDELAYLVNKIETFLQPWRPSSDTDDFYLQPNWASSLDREVAELFELLNAPLVSDSSAVEPAPVGQIMKVFISHSSSDVLVAETLIEFLRAALPLSTDDIRCTSVDGYKLPVGANVDEHLRTEVFNAVVFVALLSPSSLRSPYVLFELGARWGAKRSIVPITVGGLKPGELQSPLAAVHSINGAYEPDALQLVDDLAKQLACKPERASGYNKALKQFLFAAQQSAGKAAS